MYDYGTEKRRNKKQPAVEPVMRGKKKEENSRLPSKMLQVLSAEQDNKEQKRKTIKSSGYIRFERHDDKQMCTRNRHIDKSQLIQLPLRSTSLLPFLFRFKHISFFSFVSLLFFMLKFFPRLVK